MLRGQFMNLIIAFTLLSTFAFAETPIYEDDKYTVSIEEKQSRPGAKGKGPCGAGQEIFLQVSAVPSKKVLLNELIESCLKSIDLEESVDESVKPMGKQIFVLQESNMGILDLNGEKPEYKTTSAPSEEVKSAVMKLENCHHWSGEEPTDEKRQKEITSNLNKLGCDKLATQVENLKKKFSAEQSTVQYLDAALKEFQ